MRRVFHLLLLTTLFAGSSAMATPAIGPSNFTEMVNMLRAYGIEPSTVQWGPVNAMCLGLNDKMNEEPYNRCRFIKALDQITYLQDREQCDDTSLAFNPDAVYGQIYVNNVVVDSNAVYMPTYVQKNRLVHSEKAFRRHVFNECMRTRGWRNPRAYQQGRIGE
jgi:hypothetical protein